MSTIENGVMRIKAQDLQSFPKAFIQFSLVNI
jgi:hypothetical protein